METKIVKKIASLPKLEKKTNVAAYARVSTGKDAMLHSLSSQISYYNKTINSHEDWLLVGIYADEAFSGTKENRREFQRMIEDSKKGKIDLIITKSISRFARNTVILLETIKELRKLNVDVYFEEQNLHSFSGECDMVLTFLASFAQEESRSVSENMKWRIKKNFENGIPWGVYLYGYSFKRNKMVIVPDEAKVIREIYKWFLNGMSVNSIKDTLNKKEIKTKRDRKWCCTSVNIILRNYTYTGNLILQTTYKNNFIEKIKMKNNGELPKYLVEESHEAIIPIEEYNAVQKLIRERKEIYANFGPKETNSFTKMIVCENCGSFYRRKSRHGRHMWMCGKKIDEGAKACSQNEIDESAIYDSLNKALDTKQFNEELFRATIEKIVIGSKRVVKVIFKNGKEMEFTHVIDSRRNSWTPEMKEIARLRAIEQHRKGDI